MFATVQLCAASAHAGDTAELNILGFTANGGVFAFEEYGVQDGSGFPYANRFYIDTATDKFLPGTPIRVRIDDETATIESARAQARAEGEAFVAQTELAGNRGLTAGSNPVTELSADPHRMVVNPRAVIPPIDASLELRLEEFALDLVDAVDVERRRAAFLPDRAGSLARNHAQFGQRIASVRLDIEPDAEFRFLRPDGNHFGSRIARDHEARPDCMGRMRAP